jgi:hypothetical protein
MVIEANGRRFVRDLSREELIAELEHLVLKVVENLSYKGDAQLTFADRSLWSNVEFDSCVGIHRMKSQPKESVVRFKAAKTMHSFGRRSS